MSVIPKTFLKTVGICVFILEALLANMPQGFSQTRNDLSSLAYVGGADRTKKEEREGNEANLTFTPFQLKDWRSRQKKIAERYNKDIIALKKGKRSIRNVIMRLHSLYPTMPDYDPIGKTTIDKMTRYAYVADMSVDTEEVNEALAGYRDLLYKHIANLSVVEYAYTLSQANSRYGDPVLLRKVLKILSDFLKEEEHRKDGEAPSKAYKVITYDEETYILGLLNVTVQSSEIYQVENKFYNVHDVIYADGRYTQLYFDVSSPIYLYNKTRAAQEGGKRTVIPLQ